MCVCVCVCVSLSLSVNALAVVQNEPVSPLLSKQAHTRTQTHTHIHTHKHTHTHSARCMHAVHLKDVASLIQTKTLKKCACVPDNHRSNVGQVQRIRDGIKPNNVVVACGQANLRVQPNAKKDRHAKKREGEGEREQQTVRTEDHKAQQIPVGRCLKAVLNAAPAPPLCRFGHTP